MSAQPWFMRAAHWNIHCHRAQYLIGPKVHLIIDTVGHAQSHFTKTDWCLHARAQHREEYGCRVLANTEILMSAQDWMTKPYQQHYYPKNAIKSVI